MSLKETIIKTYEILCHEKDLSPNNQLINETLSAFVKTVIHTPYDEMTQQTLEDRSVKRIQKNLLERLSLAECSMEMFFSESFNKKQELSYSDLEEFWYLGNYRDLVADEVALLTQINKTPSSSTAIAFIGAGPLPLSAYFMATHHEASFVACLDCDNDAVKLGSGFLDKLGLSDRIKYYHQNGVVHDYSGYDTIFIASLVRDKKDVLAKIVCDNPDAIVLTRSVEEAKAILYQSVNIDEFKGQGYQMIGRTHPTYKTINSTLAFQYNSY